MENIIKSLLKAQGEFHNLSKNAKGYGYEYLTLDKLIDETREILTKNGLVIVQTLDGRDLVTTLYHETGESIVSRYELQEVAVGKANAAQQFGAAITYARRYSYAAILNIAQADDDAAGAGDARPRQKPTPKAATMHQRLLKAITKAGYTSIGAWCALVDIEGEDQFKALSDDSIADYLINFEQGVYNV
ncbi:MAG: ERF family protein [Pseudomonadales bacterium]|nr:ERF family protein [Pseudomonadales bacterium]